MKNELPFDGYSEFIKKPLEASDHRSYNLIRRVLLDNTIAPTNPFSTLLLKLTGKSMTNQEALECWKEILYNKQNLETTLKRDVGIQTASIDYFENIVKSDTILKTPALIGSAKSDKEEWLERIYTPGYHIEKLKEEILRAKRYKHALSAILLDIDEFHKINEALSIKVGDRILALIVKIVKKLIRNVDILTRYSGDRFLLILPNTNKREAMELAERLRDHVHNRTQRIEGINSGVTLTLSVGQCDREESTNEFMRHLETVLDDGKRKGRNTVYPF